MLQLHEVLDAVKSGSVGYDRTSCAFVDRRDYARLATFTSAQQMEVLGFQPLDGFKPIVWSEDLIKERLVEDASFGLEKCDNQRGISSALMFDVVNMWLWVLEDEEFKGLVYDDYGRVLFESVLRKYQE